MFDAIFRTTKMSVNVSVIDLFAGPGGLSEGFSSFSPNGTHFPFHIDLSVEKELSAHRTLELRAFFRQFSESVPEAYYSYLKGDITKEELFLSFPAEREKASAETLGGPRALGNEEDEQCIREGLEKLGKESTQKVVIGGPPCQAYSLVGRARNKGITDYIAEEDHRHYLYKEYLKVLHKVQPKVFVMENVKGILSSKVGGQHIFPTILNDLSNPAKALGQRGGSKYKIHSLVDGVTNDLLGGSGSDYIIKSEDYGIPQARHRVILLGVRNDVEIEPRKLVKRRECRVAGTLLADLPKLRSGLSKGVDTPEAWHLAIADAAEKAAAGFAELGLDRDVFADILDESACYDSRGGGFLQRSLDFQGDQETAKWYLDLKLDGFVNHETRGHIVDDLARYLFCSAYAQANNGMSPKANNFPEALAPNHANWKSGKFVDRFKVQVANKPSSTITSHISKDGHYFIHPDPSQSRSLTVREAARLQTFPDNYFFEGNRTQQYVQVGNAVPPLLASQIAEIVYDLLLE